MAREPSAALGHSASGLSQYSSTPFESGSSRIDGLADAMIRCATEPDPGLDQLLDRLGQVSPRRIPDRQVIQAGVTGRRRPAPFAMPRVQADVMMVSAGGHERRLRTVPLRELETQHTDIEPERPFEVRDLEMDVTDTGSVGGPVLLRLRHSALP